MKWHDTPMCGRSTQMIPWLLKKSNHKDEVIKHKDEVIKHKDEEIRILNEEIRILKEEICILKAKGEVKVLEKDRKVVFFAMALAVAIVVLGIYFALVVGVEDTVFQLL